MASGQKQVQSEYISTETGNRVSRRAHIHGLANIILSGKTVIHGGALIRGDLRRSGATGPAIVISAGKYCVIGEGAVIRPSCKTYKGAFSYYPVKIGEYTSIGQGAIVEAGSIGTGVEIGKNAIIGSFTVIKDFAKIDENAVVAPGTTVPSLTRWAGNPARQVAVLPESTPELVETRMKADYARFEPV